MSLKTVFANGKGIDRRTVLRGGLAGLGAAYVLPWNASTAQAHGSRAFTLGVASGDPEPHSVVIWTRLAPEPLTPDGGMPAHPVPVQWEVARDPGMRDVVRRGSALALPEAAHTVHVTVDGLDPDRWYFFRFFSRGEDSPVGRTRTFPRAHDACARMRFGLVSCQDFQNGFYSAYANLAAENLDFVVHVGDYIYEDGTRAGAPRTVVGPETMSLADYRVRYSEYRLDPALQAVHAAFPFIPTFDDHEVENNYAGAISEDNVDPALFLARRAGAYQAYFEHLPLRDAQRPHGSAIHMFRRLHFGRLATLHVLDTRQHRTDQPCGDGLKPVFADTLSPTATMTGAVQEAWLKRGLDRSDATWNVLAQQVMFTKWNIQRGAGAPVPIYNMDAWDGYVAARQRLLDFLAERNPANPVILSGDIHSSFAANILENFDQPDAGIVAAEFVGTSITSDFPAAFVPAVQATLPDNPHIRFFDGLHHGYVRFDVSPQLWRADYRGVESILTPTSPVSTLASFVVEAGLSGITPA
jgi:alkaline phosphatase D